MPSTDPRDLRDAAVASWPVQHSREVHRSPIITVRTDSLVGDDGATFDRDVVEHLGSVAVLAVNDSDEVLLIRQYRHAVGAQVVEIPAGLRDVADEPPEQTARRELAEEGHVAADRWTPLMAYWSSPGISTERLQVFLAEDVRDVAPPDDFVAAHEEAAMQRFWVPFDDVLAAVMRGDLGNGVTVVAVLAEAARRQAAPSPR